MKFLIVGGGGFVGSWLTHELLSRHHQVVVIDPFIYYSDWDHKRVKVVSKFKKQVLLKGARVYRGRFEDAGEEIVKKEKPEIIIHLAGIPLEKADNFEISLKQLTDDIGLTYRIVDVIKRNPVKKFVFMSSIAAYGDCKKMIDENFPLIPKTPYGIMKAAGEFITKAELNNWNIVRTTNIYGFADLNGRASNIILQKILNGEKFWVNSEIVMDFINVKDLVRGIADVAIKAPFNEVFHISGGAEHLLTDFIEIVERDFPIEYEVKKLNDRPKRGIMNNQKARKMLGWSPKMGLTDGVWDYLKYVKKYKIS